MEIGRFVTQKNKRLLGAAILTGLVGLSTGLCIEGPFKKDSAKVPAAPTVPSEPVTVTPLNFEPSLSDVDIEQSKQDPVVYARMSRGESSYGLIYKKDAFGLTCPEGSNGFVFRDLDLLGNPTIGVGSHASSGGIHPNPALRAVNRFDLFINPGYHADGIYLGVIKRECYQGSNLSQVTNLVYMIELGK